ncbi:MAG TPA: putative selenate ABC transporter substrate-binding protein [Anaerolineae bacterium]|jgi:phosphonate transport system substrate-binding protein
MKKIIVLCLVLVSLLLLAACGQAAATQEEAEPFVIGAIPDQDPEVLQRQFSLVATYLSNELGVPVEYKPVTDYAASVTAFRVGDLDMVWFGRLTGVQARLQVDEAQALVQRTIDEQFHSVFIAGKDSGIEPFEDIDGLAQLKGHTFTFGSESSTSGRLMPQYFLNEGGVTLGDFRGGEPGFSGSHDATIDLVEAGTYESGALNEQVWKSRVEAGEVDLDKVQMIWRTPPYHDYHWVIHPDVNERYGQDFADKVTAAFLKLDAGNADQKEILDLFGADGFIATENDNYMQIEAVGREIGAIN